MKCNMEVNKVLVWIYCFEVIGEFYLTEIKQIFFWCEYTFEYFPIWLILFEISVLNILNMHKCSLHKLLSFLSYTNNLVDY